MSQTQNTIFKVAVIGSGPSGFYAAEELLAQTNLQVSVDMFDRLPTPFGLVRGGVAPDHQKIKSVVKVYEKTAARNGFRFFGNVEFGRDLLLEDFKKCYHAVLFAVGAKSDRKMEIPGEELQGSVPATSFVGWYNGHPDYRDFIFDLSCERVAVVGNGNVAMDVTRILAADPEILKTTDIASYALEALKKSKVKDIFLLGRRGAAQAAFTNPEIRELCNLPGSDLIVDPKEVELDELTKEAVQSGSIGTTAKNNIEVLTEQSKRPAKGLSKKIHIRFLVSPVELIGKGGKVSAVKLEKNRLYKHQDGSLRPKGTGEYEVLPIEFILRSVGYKGLPLQGLPYDEKSGVIPNDAGRVIDPRTKKTIPGLYVVGWAKRGPTGVIGTNKPDSIETAKKAVEDLSRSISDSNGRKGPDGDQILNLLKQRKTRFVTFNEWQVLDALEIQKGKITGKVREKFTTISEMVSTLDRPSASLSL